MQSRWVGVVLILSLALVGCAGARSSESATTLATATPEPLSQTLAQTSSTATPLLPSAGDRGALQPSEYPGIDWSRANTPESLGWSSAKLAVAQAYFKRIGSAAVMIVEDGLIVAAWGNTRQKYQRG